MKRDKGVIVRMGAAFAITSINMYIIEGLLQHYGVQEQVPLIPAFLNIESLVILLACVFYEMYRSGSFQKNTKIGSSNSIGFFIGMLLVVFYFIYIIAKDWSLWIEFF